jgi:hypothetical protein
LDKWHVTTSDLGTQWKLTIRGGEFLLIGANPDSAQFPREHDEVVIACHGEPKHLEMTATYVTPSRSVFTASLTSEAFAASVKQLKLAIAKTQEGNEQTAGSGDPTQAMAIDASDVLVQPHSVKTHSVETTLNVKAAMVSFLQSAQEINLQFYTSDKDYYGFVMTLPTDRTEIAEFAKACK